MKVQTRTELAELLYQNVMHNEGGVIAINKPYGLRNGTGFDDPLDTKFKTVNRFNFSLTEVLPLLASMLNVPNLTVARSPEKFASGLTLLNVDNEAGIKISKAVKHPTSPAVYSYQAVCHGVPLLSSNSGERLGLTTNESDLSVKLSTDQSANKIKTKKMKQIYYKYKVLNTNPDLNASLVEVSTNRILWYYVPLYLATRLLTPVIGDQIHGNSVKYLFGKPVHLPTFNVTGFNPQKLPEDICKRLEVDETDSLLIPNHLHLSSVTLYHFSRKEPKHLTIHAPPPPHFQWTCSQLKLWNEPENLLPVEVAF